MSNDIKKFLDQSGVTILWNKTVEKVESEADRAQKAEKVNADAIEAIQKDYLKAADKEEVIAYVDNKVGTVPEGSTVMGIIQNIQENAYDDTELRDLVESKADKTQVATDIAAAVKVETDARVEAVAAVQGEIDALEQAHATVKEALEGAIALKADQTALEGVKATAEAAVAKADYDVKVKALEDEDARIAGLVASEQSRAEGAEAGLAARIKTVEDDYLKAADKTELSNAITAEAERAAGVEAGLEERLVEVETFFKTAENETINDALDTLVEIQKYITEDGTAADEMIKDIAANAEAIADLAEEVAATYETKEDAIDKYNEVKALVEEKAVQADWNQNDETAPDYIKNRPFYDEENLELILEAYDVETTDVTNGLYGAYEFKTFDTMPQNGERLVFELNGDKYNVTYEQIDRYSMGFGNYHLVNVGSADNGIDFCVAQHTTGSGTDVNLDEPISLYTRESGVYDVKIYRATATVAKQLDEKYIPDTIARVADLTDTTGRVEALENEMDAVKGRLDVAEPKVETLESEMDAVEGRLDTVESAVDTKAEAQALTDAISALEGVDAGQETRIAALEAKFGEGEGNVESQIAAAVADEAATREAADAELEAAIAQALQDAKDDSADRDIVVLAEAQKGIETAEQNAKDFATGLNNSLAERVGTLEAAIADKSDLTALETRVKAVEDELAGFEAITAEELETIFNSVE